MSSTRTQLGDIAPVGDELDESALHGISGGLPRTVPSYIDPPGTCSYDVTYGMEA
ncbi:hypothetical protein ABT061_04330 [Streptosporangium sp. NPDC002544]|uniref:hypothetical protein n=1 Tax=Streptosporangium sp. NPDC002544 TaxID=3154538 RepID=UPI0033227E1F